MSIKPVRPPGAFPPARPTGTPSQVRPSNPYGRFNVRPAIRPDPQKAQDSLHPSPPVDRPAYGKSGHVEVDEATYQARLKVAEGLEKGAAGYSCERGFEDAPELTHFRGVARLLDERLERLREKEEDQVESPQVDEAALPPGRGGEVPSEAAGHPEDGPPVPRLTDPCPDDPPALAWDRVCVDEAENWGEESGVDWAPDEANADEEMAADEAAPSVGRQAPTPLPGRPGLGRSWGTPDDVEESPEPCGATIAAVDTDDPVDGVDVVMDETVSEADLAEKDEGDDAPSAPKFGPIGPRNRQRGELDDFLDACFIVDDEILALLGVEDDDGDDRIEAYLNELHVGDSPEAQEYAARVQEVLAEIRADAAAESAVAARSIEVPTASAEVPAPVFDLDSPRIRALVPPGYRLAHDGLFAEMDDEPPVRVTMQPVCVDGRVCSTAENSFALRLRALNPKRKAIELLVEMERLPAGKTAIAAELANLGVSVLKPALFVPFLQLSSERPGLPEIIGVSRMGFASAPLTEGGSTLCFVLPGRTLYPRGKNIAEEVVLLPQAQAAIHRAYHQMGKDDEWRALAESTRGEVLPTFTMCLDFAASLAPYGGAENGGVHLYASTSRGKTFALQMAATVFGNGAAGAGGVTGMPTLVRSWHGTPNAVEAMTAEVSGTLAIFDEVGAHRGPVSAYTQTGGQGKGRANSRGQLTEAAAWRTLILSSGEIPLSHHAEAMGGGPTMGGEAVRMLDVPVDGLLPEFDPLFMEARKRACGRHYGWAGPAFVQWVLDRCGGDEVALATDLTGAVNVMRNQLCDEVEAARRVLQTHHRRAMLRLALAAVAGQWAVEAGVLPHTEAEVLGAVRAVRDAWLGGQSFESDDERAVSKVRDYVSRHRGQMADTAACAAGQRVPGNCRGILHQDHVLLTPSNFADACRGLHAESVASALKRAGILHTNEPRHNTVKVSVAALGIAAARFYKLDLAMLFNEDAEQGGVDVGTGAGPDGDDPAGSA